MEKLQLKGMRIAPNNKRIYMWSSSRLSAESLHVIVHPMGPPPWSSGQKLIRRPVKARQKNFLKKFLYISKKKIFLMYLEKVWISEMRYN